jgi:dephospho-CoA kinase
MLKKSKLLKIGLTGGIASGKSAVSQLFKQQSVSVIDADNIARELLTHNISLLDKIKHKFGSSIFFDDHSLNRKALAQIVFNSSADLAWLNQLTHPLVAQKIQTEIDLLTSVRTTPDKAPLSYVILDIPLLVDKNGCIPQHLEPFIDRILVVKTSVQSQRDRLTKRDGVNEAHADKIIQSQSTLAQKLALADDIIDNDGPIEQLEPQVLQLHNYYLSLTTKDGKL